MTSRPRAQRRQTARPRTREQAQQARQAREQAAQQDQRPTPETLEAQAAQERFREAQQALGGRSVMEFVAEGGEVEVLRDLGIPPETITALQQVQPFLNGDQTIEVGAALEAGVEPEALAQIVPRESVQQAREGLQQRREQQEALERLQEAEGVTVEEERIEVEDLEAADREDLLTVGFTEEQLQAAPGPQQEQQRESPGLSTQLQQFRRDFPSSFDFSEAVGAVRQAVQRGWDPEAPRNEALASRRAAETIGDIMTNVRTARANLEHDVRNAEQGIRVAQRRIGESHFQRAGQDVERAVDLYLQDFPPSRFGISREGARKTLIGNFQRHQELLAEKQQELEGAQERLREFRQVSPQVRPFLESVKQDQIATLGGRGTAAPITDVEAGALAGTGDIGETDAPEDATAFQERNAALNALAEQGLAEVGEDGQVQVDVGEAVQQGVARETLLDAGFTEEQISEAAQRRRDLTAAQEALQEAQEGGIITEDIRERLEQVMDPEEVDVIRGTLRAQQQQIGDISSELRAEAQSALQEAQETGVITQEIRSRLEPVMSPEEIDTLRGTLRAQSAQLGDIQAERETARQRLLSAGVMDQEGAIDVLGALDAGIPEETLREVGLTQDQINTAKVQPTLVKAGPIPAPDVAVPAEGAAPTAEPQPVVPFEERQVSQDLETEIEESRDFLQQSIGAGAAFGGPPVSVGTPEGRLAQERLTVLEGLKAQVEAGGLPSAEADRLAAQLPTEPTQEQIDQAKREFAQMAVMSGQVIPVAGAGFGIAHTAITWDESEPWARGLNIGLDVAGTLPVLGATAGAARGGVRTVGGIAREVAIADLAGNIEAVTRPASAIKRGIINPVETLVRPSKVPINALETSTTTVRVPATQFSRLDPATLPQPPQVAQDLRSGVFAGDVKRGVDVAGLGAVRGEQVTAPTTPTGTVSIRPAGLQRTTGAAAVHGSPDVRPFLMGTDIVDTGEGGLFVAPSLHTRFTQAASGAGTPPSAVRLGDLPDQPVPGAVIIRDPELLDQLETSGKLFGGRAEVEQVLRSGVSVPPPSQVLMTRNAAGDKLALLVVGKPFTAAERGRLKLAGMTDTITNIVQAPGRVGVRGADEAVDLAKQADDLLAQSRRARTAGNQAEAARLLREAERLERASLEAFGTMQGRALANLANQARSAVTTASRQPVESQISLSRTGTEGRVAGGVTDDRDGRFGDQRNLRGTGRVVTADRIGDDLGRPARSPEAETRQGLADLSRLADLSSDRTLTRQEAQRASSTLAELRRAPLTEAQRQEVQRAEITIARTTALPEPTRTPETPRTPRVTEAPRITTPGRTPRVPDAPRIPITPETPRVPATARIPAEPETPRILPGERRRGEDIDLPDSADAPSQPTEKDFPRIVGVSRGAVGETAVDLGTGSHRTVKDIDEVPNRPTKESFTVLTTGDTPTGPRRVPWGALDQIIFPTGQQVFIKAGAPLEDAIRKRDGGTPKPRPTSPSRNRSRQGLRPRRRL